MSAISLQDTEGDGVFHQLYTIYGIPEEFTCEMGVRKDEIIVLTALNAV